MEILETHVRWLQGHVTIVSKFVGERSLILEMVFPLFGFALEHLVEFLLGTALVSERTDTIVFDGTVAPVMTVVNDNIDEVSGLGRYLETLDGILGFEILVLLEFAEFDISSCDGSYLAFLQFRFVSEHGFQGGAATTLSESITGRLTFLGETIQSMSTDLGFGVEIIVVVHLAQTLISLLNHGPVAIDAGFCQIVALGVYHRGSKTVTNLLSSGLRFHGILSGFPDETEHTESDNTGHSVESERSAI